MGIGKWRPYSYAPGSHISRGTGANQGQTASGDYLRHAGGYPDRESNLAFLGALFDIHVFELAGLEDFAALLAFDELGILGSADDLHAWVLARLLYITALRRGRLWGHKSGRSPSNNGGGYVFAGISRYFRPGLPLVKSPIVTAL